MLMKRHFATPNGWQPQRNTRQPNGQLLVPSLKEGDCLNPPPLKHIEVKHTGFDREQNFSEDLIANAMREGWARFDGSLLVLDAKPEPLTYTVKRAPGRYCVHCAERLPDNDPSGEQSRAHVAERHAGVASPDPAWPAGYAVVHAYECVLNAEQHGRFRKLRAGEKRHG
jgi:hypothetical protein